MGRGVEEAGGGDSQRGEDRQREGDGQRGGDWFVTDSERLSGCSSSLTLLLRVWPSPSSLSLLPPSLSPSFFVRNASSLLLLLNCIFLGFLISYHVGEDDVREGITELLYCSYKYNIIITALIIDINK